MTRRAPAGGKPGGAAVSADVGNAAQDNAAPHKTQACFLIRRWADAIARRDDRTAGRLRPLVDVLLNGEGGQ